MLIRSFGGAAARLLFAAFAISGFSAAAEAQFITYVSATGNDANPCTAQSAPCRTLQRGVNATPAGGELRLLTPIHGNVVVAKSITILGNGATVVGVITINNASAVVALRDLTLNGRHAFGTGINILAAAAVHIEDCTVERYTGDGIKLVATTATQLFISDTVARENTGNGAYVADANANALVTVKDSRFENNGAAGLFLGYVPAVISDSVFTNNNTIGIWNGGTGVLISNSVISSNPTAIYNNGPLYTRQNNTLGGPVTGNTTPTPYAAF